MSKIQVITRPVINRVHIGKYELNSRTFQEFLRDFHTVFKE